LTHQLVKPGQAAAGKLAISVSFKPANTCDRHISRGPVKTEPAKYFIAAKVLSSNVQIPKVSAGILVPVLFLKVALFPDELRKLFVGHKPGMRTLVHAKLFQVSLFVSARETAKLQFQ